MVNYYTGSVRVVDTAIRNRMPYLASKADTLFSLSKPELENHL